MELISIFIGNFLVLGVFYLVGSLLLFPHNYFIKDSSPYAVLFHKLFFGVLGSITLFSLYSTRFFSVNLIFLLLYAFVTVYALAKRKINWNLNFSVFFSDTKKLPYLFPVIIIAIAVGLFKHHYFLSENYFIGHRDVIYYLQLGRFFPIAHSESMLPWNSLISGSGETFSGPYHYGDLWFSSICINICFFLLPMVTHNFVITPVLIILTGSALTCLIQILLPSQVKIFHFSYFNNSKFSELFIAVVGFLFAMYWGYTPKFPLAFIHTISIEHKIFNFIFPVSYAVFCFLKDKRFLSFTAISSVFILDFIYFPIFFAGTGLIAFILIIRKKTGILKFFLIPLVFSIYILMFYYIDGSLFSVDLSSPKTDLFSFGFIADSLSIIINYLLRHFLTCFPFYFSLFFVFKNRKLLDDKIVYLFIFFICIIGVSLLLAGFSHNHREFWQFARTINPSTSILLLLFLTSSFKNEKIISKRVFLVLFSVVFFQSFFAVLSQSTQSLEIKESTKYSIISRKAIDDISHFIKKDMIIANYADNKIHTVGVTYDEYNFSGFLKKNIWFVELNLPDEISPNSGVVQEMNLKTSPFFEYVQKLKNNRSFTGMENAQVEFLKENNIDHVLLLRKNSPAVFMEYVVDSLFFDNKKLLKLYKLKF